MNQKTSLDLIQIAAPCHVSWDTMTGDERQRHCQQCQLTVYNVSEMSRAEAEAFIAGREGRTCLRLYRREDGTVLTRDCPVGIRYLRQRLARAVAAIAGVLLALVSGTLFGSIASRVSPGSLKSPANAFANWIDPPPQFHMLMGDIICPPLTPTAAPNPAMQEPAETPLLPPTAEQMQQILQRLEK